MAKYFQIFTIAVFALIFAGTLNALAQTVVKPAEDQVNWVELGKADFQKGDYDKAISELTRAIDLNPNSYDLYNWRSFCWLAKGDYQKSLADCNKALDIDPGEGLSYLNRGVVYQSLNRESDAVDDYQHGVDLARTNQALRNLITEKLGDMKGQTLANLVNGRIDDLRSKLGAFEEKGKKQADFVNSGPSPQAVCQSINDLLPTFEALQNALHRTLFVRLIAADAITNLAPNLEAITKAETHITHDGKLIEDEKVVFKCGN